VLVHAGDVLAKEQPVVELETDKATIEVPSSVSGRITDVRVKTGDKVKVGQVLLVVDEAGAADEAKPAAAETKPAGAETKPAAAETKPGGASPPADGVEAAPPAQADAAVEGGLAQDARPRGGPAPAPGRRGKEERAEGKGEVEPPEERSRRVVDISAGRAPAPQPSATVAAAPSTRRYARELGLDVAQVPGTGPGGRISVDDVKAQARAVITGAAGRPGLGQAAPLPDFSKWGEVEREPMRAVRRKTAEHMARAWNTIPHVTQGDKADITGLEELRKRYAKKVEAAGAKLTVTAIAIKVVAAALKVFPQFNASIDVANEQIVYKHYINIGVAVDTEFGLLVPVLRNVDQKNIVQIATELASLADKAKARKLSLDEMDGSTFTVTNLGGIGGTYFTPIVNTPEVAILGISRSSTEPVYINGSFEPRLLMPLSLSYDHRLIDGADAIRFLRWIVEALEQPFVISLQG
jgi:pyruvate dehydrogenase E2 component (dihydrolipoamide acetyltransferase)